MLHYYKIKTHKKRKKEVKTMKMKRLFCAFLALILMFSCVTVSASAIDTENTSEVNSYTKQKTTSIKSKDWSRVIYSSNMARSDTIRITLNNDGNDSHDYSVTYCIEEHMASPSVPNIITEYTLNQGDSVTHALNTVGNNFTIYAKYTASGLTGTITSTISLYISA